MRRAHRQVGAPAFSRRELADENGTWGEKRYIDEHFISLENGEPIVIIANAVTAACYCEWVLEVKTRSGTEDETVVVDHNGKPFRLTAFAPPYGSEFERSLSTQRFDDLTRQRIPRWEQ